MQGLGIRLFLRLGKGKKAGAGLEELQGGESSGKQAAPLPNMGSLTSELCGLGAATIYQLYVNVLFFSSEQAFT